MSNTFGKYLESRGVVTLGEVNHIKTDDEIIDYLIQRKNYTKLFCTALFEGYLEWRGLW